MKKMRMKKMGKKGGQRGMKGDVHSSKKSVGHSKSGGFGKK